MSATMNDYIQQETITGVVPMTNGDRQYSFWDLFLSTSGFAIATWCYTQGAYVAQYLTFNQMLINILVLILFGYLSSVYRLSLRFVTELTYGFGYERF